MHISEAARRSGVSAKMIRYYESAGILPAAGRKANGYRDYSDGDVSTLQFLRRTRDLGFSMEETRDLLNLWRDPSRPSREVKQLAERRVADLTRRIAEMQAVRDVLERLSGACVGDERPDCPILNGLAKGAARPAAH